MIINIMCPVCFYMYAQAKTINGKCFNCHKDTQMEFLNMKYEWNDGHPFLSVIDGEGFYRTFPLPKEDAKIPPIKDWDVSPLFFSEDELS